MDNRTEFEMEHTHLKLARFSADHHVPTLRGQYLFRTTQKAWDKWNRQREAQPSSCGHSPERCKC